MGQGIDSALNKQGAQQTRQLAQYLQTEKISYIYSSDLGRAIYTAREISSFHPKTPLILSPHLRERNLGIYEGQPNNEWRKATEQSSLPFHIFKPPQGESYAELQQRISPFFDTLIIKHKNDTVLLVSHTGALTMLLLKILDRPISK